MNAIDRLDRSDVTGPASLSLVEAEEGGYEELVQSARNAKDAAVPSIEGVWTAEIYGPYGWENNGTYVLDRGRVLGGSDRHYAAGHYRFIDNNYRAEITVNFHGKPRTIFGERCDRFEIVVIGTSDNGVIEAQMDRKDKSGFGVRYRMTKRLGLPAGKP